MMDVTEVFCKADDFWKVAEPEFKRIQLGSGKVTRDRKTQMSTSEMITIVILFHGSCYRHFKGFYRNIVQNRLNHEFPNQISYARFVQLMPRILVPLLAFLNSIKGPVTGISIVDSTSICVCKNKRIGRHKVFSGLAERGKSTMGWFFGFKLHLIVNDRGDLLSFGLTKGNVDDRKPVLKLAKNITGKLLADKGYVSQKLFDSLLAQGTQLITTIRSNMKNRLMDLTDRLLLRKRFLIETINDQLKNISQIEHSRHRSPSNFIINLFAGLIAYQFQEKKPSMNFSSNDLNLAFA